MRSLQDLVNRAKFNYVNSAILNGHFQAPPRFSDEEVEYKLFDFDRDISSEQVVGAIEQDGYQAANLYELLAWDQWNEKSWIVAVGEVANVDRNRFVCCLGRSGPDRLLSLGWWDTGWNTACRFLAVKRKI